MDIKLEIPGYHLDIAKLFERDLCTQNLQKPALHLQNG